MEFPVTFGKNNSERVRFKRQVLRKVF